MDCRADAKGCESDWLSVNNGNQPLKPVNPNVNASATTLAQIQPAFATGQGVPGYFVSESGATTMSSFESMSATLSQENWGLHVRPPTSLPAPFQTLTVVMSVCRRRRCSSGTTHATGGSTPTSG